MTNKIYIGKVTLENFASFKGKHEFDFMDKKGVLNQWTVILGNNNAGKTNFLRAIAGLEPVTHQAVVNGNNVIVNIPVATLMEMGGKSEETSVTCSFVYSPNLSADINTFKGKLDSYTKYSFHNTEDVLPFNVYDFNRWGYGYRNGALGTSGFKDDFKLFGYGVSRRYADISLTSKENSIYNSQTLFSSNATLVNLEEWLLQLGFADKNGDKVATRQLEKLTELIESDIFPEIKAIHFISELGKSHVEFETTEGKRRLNSLGYGYQTTLSWIFDLSKKMFERYPDSEHPLKEAAVVLIDELDLHLHPQWQREIIEYLSNIFVQTQFIVTTHSPFIIQSIDKINLFVLNKTEEGITVEKSPFSTFKGWTVEEILEDLLGLEDKTKSDEYKRLMDDFDEGLDTDDYEKANKAYEKLKKILHPTSAKRKVLEIQLSQLIPND